MSQAGLIEITGDAAAQLKKLMAAEGVDASGVRVGVRGGGCSGLSYTLDFETDSQEKDRVFEGPLGIKLFVDVKSFLFLAGTRLDYSGGLNGKGFEFNNPNATATCGCGSSFAA
jgi:iron-sulfur cluster assembly protein